MPIEATIKGYHLTTIGSAARVCVYEVKNSGYTIRQIRSVADFSATRLFAVQPGDPLSRAALSANAMRAVTRC